MYKIEGFGDNGWYVWNGYIGEDDARYLHKDYVWRKLTRNGRDYTGYFETKREAEEALLMVLSKDKDELAVLRAIYALHGRSIDKVINYKQVCVNEMENS